VLKLDPAFERALQHLTWTYRDLERFDGMAEAARRYAASVGSPEAYRLLADAHSQSGDVEGGLKVLRAARESVPERRRAIDPHLAALQVQAGEYEDAERTIAGALKEAPADTSAQERRRLLTDLGWAYFNGGAPRHAEASLRRALASAAPKPDARVFNGLGWSLLRQQREVEAEDVFRQGLTIDPKEAGIINGLFTLKLQQKNYAEAIAFGERYVKAWPESPFSRGPSIQAHLAAGHSEEAGAALKAGLSAMSSDANRRGLLVQVAASYRTRRDYGKADALLKQAQALDTAGKDARVLVALGLNFMGLKRYAEAERAFRSALDLKPWDWPTLNGLARLYAVQKNYEAAEGCLSGYLKSRPTRRNRQQVELQTGRLKLVAGDYAAAERHLKESLSLDSTEDSGAYRLLGYLRAEQRRFAEAMAFTEKALSINPAFENKNLAAWLLVAGGLDLERGSRLAEEALGRMPDGYAVTAQESPFLVWPEHSLGLAYLKKGQLQKAVEYLERAARALPERQAIRDDLEQARTRLAQRRSGRLVGLVASPS